MGRKGDSEGYTQIPNPVLEALTKAPLPGRQLRAVLAMARLTYGWHQHQAAISLTTIGKLTGLSSKAHISEIVSHLVDRGILTVTGKGNRGCKKYCINHHIGEWKLHPAYSPRVPKDGNRRRTPQGFPRTGTEGFPRTGTEGFPPEGTIKESIKKSLKEREKETKTERPPSPLRGAPSPTGDNSPPFKVKSPNSHGTAKDVYSPAPGDCIDCTTDVDVCKADRGSIACTRRRDG